MQQLRCDAVSEVAILSLAADTLRFRHRRRTMAPVGVYGCVGVSRVMDKSRQLLTIELDGTRYRGAYSLEQDRLVIEAYGLGRTEVDASLVDYCLGEPAHKLAKLIFTQLVRENVSQGSDLINLIAQGSTTQVTFIGGLQA
jgi:hypothetical protein